MLIKLDRTGSHARFWPPVPAGRDAIVKILDGPFSYKRKGYFWSPKFKARQWDGKVHLVRTPRDGSVSVPGGLGNRAVELLVAVGHEIEDKTPPYDYASRVFRGTATWGGPSLRPYQQAAHDAAVAAGRGILKLPVRSGKTLLAGRVALTLGYRTLFVVSADLLLGQAEAEFKANLPGLTVARVGAGEWNTEGDVVVATVQTLAERYKTREYAALSRTFPLVFADECHHLREGETWRDAILSLAAPHKFGLSATVKLDPKGENEPGDIWLHAICGPIVYEAGFSDLIEEGFLVRPRVRFVRHNAPEVSLKAWSPMLYDQAAVHCEARNRVIIDLAVRHAREGRRVLVDVSRIAHARLLAAAIDRELDPGQTVALTGKTGKPIRGRALAALRAGKVRVIVGTLLGEGVDLPELDVVVNAEGGKAEVSTVQRLRNLTTCDGKSEALIYEMLDDHSEYLNKWTLERYRIYRRERAFTIEIDPE